MTLKHLFLVDGSYAITSGSDKKVKLWNPQTGLLLKTYGGHADQVVEAIGSCDSCHILSGSLDRSLIYWDVTTAQPLRRLRCHAGGVSCIAFSEDSNGKLGKICMIYDRNTVLLLFIYPQSLFLVQKIIWSCVGTFEHENSRQSKR